MYQVAIGWQWGSTPPWSAFWPWHLLDQLKPFWGSKHVLFQLVFAKRHFTRHTWQKWESMFSFSLLLQTNISLGVLDKHVLFCKLAFYPICLTKHAVFQLILQNGISPGILDKACSLLACFCTTAFYQAYLTKMTKHVLFQLLFAQRHFTRHTWQKWQSMFSFSLVLQRWQNTFSFSLFLEDGISPGILDKACSLSIFHQAYLTKMTKHVLFRLVFAQRPFTRHTWQKWQSMFSFSLVLQNGISPGILKARSLSAYLSKRHFTRHSWKKHVLFQLAFAKRHFTRPTWQTCSRSACFCKLAFHPVYLTKHVLF